MFQQINALKAESLNKVYLIFGDEPFFIDLFADKIRQIAMPDHERGFNEIIAYGKDISVGGLIQQSKTFPMMGDRRLVLIKDAQACTGWNEDKSQKELEEYFKNPLQSTVLVLCFHGKPDGRKAWTKTASKLNYGIECKKPYDNKLPELVTEMVHQKGVKVSAKAIQLLVEHIGTDLKRMYTEIEKVIVNLKEGEGIDASHVEKYIGISKEYNVFELQKALAQRDQFKSQLIAKNLSANDKENPLQQISILLYNYFSKVLAIHMAKDRSDTALAAMLGVHPFFVKDYLMAANKYDLWQCMTSIEAIQTLDLQSKGVNSGQITKDQILSDAVWKITHA